MSAEAEMHENEFFAAHRAIPAPAFADADPQDAVQMHPRTPPRHRARRRKWKPPVSDQYGSGLQSVQPQHAYDGNSFMR